MAREIDNADAVGGPIGGGSFDSSTPGPPIGDPDRATSSSFPSRDRRMPRGRLPTAILSTTCPAAGSMTMTFPPVSSETYNRMPEVNGGGVGVGEGAGAGVVADDDGGGVDDDPPHPPIKTVTHTIASDGTVNGFRIAASA